MANTLITQLNNPAVLQATNRRLAVGVNLLLIVACAYLLVEITWMIVPQEKDAGMQLQQRRQQPVIENQARQNSFNQLASANIFGVSEKNNVQSPATVPETKLNLTLKGVLSATTMERASAIIAQGKAGKEDIYGVGDKMPGGVSIREIHPDYVVLDRNGRLETLKLQKESGLDDISTSTNSRSTSKLSPGRALKEIRGNILKNPTSFGEYALPVIVKENGRQIGYRLQPQQKGELLSELGIQSTDVITEINGVKLDQPQNGISALRKLSTATNLDIVVKRNGAEIPLNISLQ